MVSRFTKYGVSGLLGAVFAAQLARAGPYDSDRPGGQDHPILSRYQGSILYSYGDENFGVAPLVVSDSGKPVLRDVEGRISNKMYWAPKGRSPVEVFRNYQQALRAGGFDTLYTCETDQCEKARLQTLILRVPEKMKWVMRDYHVEQFFGGAYEPGAHFLSARKNTPSGPVHVQIAVVGGRDEDPAVQGRTRQFVQVIESAQLEGGKVTVDAKAIGDALRRDGKFAFYGVLFDTNKATITTSSSAALQEMAGALKANPALKVFIVGHTDNQGDVDANLALSQKRAEAVVEQLKTRYGVAAERLSARGVANFAPIGSNLNEDGRAKNRRVEMVVR
jgi:OOP family OmpA-OmpF porin